MATEKEIKLFKQDIHEDSLKQLDSCRRLESLNLRYCRIRCNNIWKILRDKEVSEIVELKLNYTDLHDKIDGLVEFVVLKKVERLSLINTHIQNDDLRTFEDELSKQDEAKVQLQFLNLMHNAIEPGGFQILAGICNLLPPVIVLLDVTNCELDDDAVESFFETISDGKVIRCLIMSQNDRITPGGMVSIGGVAEKCKTETLDLSVCSMQDAHLDGIAKASPKALRHLLLSKNMELSPSKIIALYRDWKWLKTVEVRECWFDRRDLELLTEELKGCQVISGDIKNNDHNQRTVSRRLKRRIKPIAIDRRLEKSERRGSERSAFGPTPSTDIKVARSHSPMTCCAIDVRDTTLAYEPRVRNPKFIESMDGPRQLDKEKFLLTPLPRGEKRQKVGPEGGEISLQGCSIDFPEEALEEEIEFHVTLDNEPNKLPSGGIAITPILRCRPSIKFGKPVSVKRSTWYSAIGNAEITAVLYQRDVTTDWIEKKNVTLTDKNEVRYDVNHFSDDVVVVSKEASSEGEYHLINDVYIQKDTATISSVFFVEQRAHDLATVDMRNRGVVPMLMKPRHIIAKMGKIISVAMTCRLPDFATPQSCGDPKFTITPEFLKKREHEIYFELDQLPHDYTGKISIKYYLTTGDEQPEVLPLTTFWPIVLPEEKVVHIGQPTTITAVNVGASRSIEGHESVVMGSE